MKKIITHNGKFHSDDVFAVATISIFFGADSIEIIRTRDEKVIEQGDIIADVGGKYDGERFFDHHQKGGAGIRENGIPYASFGLVWKRFGEQICNSKSVFNFIDSNLVQFIDAGDSGLGEAKPFFKEVVPFSVVDAINILNQERTSKDEDDLIVFEDAVSFAGRILRDLIRYATKFFEDKKTVIEIYEKTEDKRLLVFEDNYDWQEVLGDYKEVLYVVEPDDKKLPNHNWRLSCVRAQKNSFINRKDLPKEWAGLRDEDLAKASGVSDAVFCHNMLFMAIAKSKDGILKMAEKALLR